MMPRDPLANVKWTDSMRGVQSSPSSRYANRNGTWSPLLHYAASIVIGTAGALAAYSVGIERAPVIVRTRVEQPIIKVAAPPPFCEPLANYLGPETNDAAEVRLLASRALPTSEKERIAERAAWSRVEAARINARVDWATELLKSRDKLLGGSSGSTRAPGKRSEGSPSRRKLRRTAEKAQATQPDHGGGAFLDRSQW